MMRTYNIILLAISVCIGGVIFFFACKYTYESKLSELKKKAEVAFDEAINQELINRNLKGDISLNFNLATVTDDVSSIVYWEDESGRHEYLLDIEKSTLNITDDTNVRLLHSVAFKKKPLQPDSLNVRWRTQLELSTIILKSALCISLTSTDGGVKLQNTYQSEWCNSSNIVFTRYIGYACEIEVKGYLYYSIWSMIYKEILLYLSLYLILGYGFYKSFIALRRKIHSFHSKEIVEIINEVPVEVIKEVPVEIHVIEEVQKVSTTPIRSYKLGEHIIFYADRNVVMVDGIEKKNQAQACLLLELFLNASNNDYILKDNIIIDTLWSDGSGNDKRMHKAVGRLRSFINGIDPSLNILRKVGAYQLIISENSSFE